MAEECGLVDALKLLELFNTGRAEGAMALIQQMGLSRVVRR